MLYSVRTARDFAYKDVFERAREELGLKMVYVITDESPALAAIAMRT